jgi:xanthine dehydrogenase YagS FAD-binding subunit
VKAFTFVRPATVEEAAAAAAEKGSVIKAGGTDLLDRMKERIDEPQSVVWFGDVRSDATARSILHATRGEREVAILIGSLVTLAEIAASSDVLQVCPALAEAAGLAASPQIRSRATLGGNLLQHTRCGYYRHKSFPCFKRGDDACPVLDEGAVQDTAAIFGNRSCASAHPSSLAPVLAACATMAFIIPANAPQNEFKGLKVAGELFATSPTRGQRSDSRLEPGEVLWQIQVDARANRRAAYEEVRQKAAFDWALVSCCVRLDMDGDKVREAAVWLGSVAPIPWHAEAAEKALAGKTLTDETIRAAADAAVAGATPLPGNAYKVDLVKVVVRRALERLRGAK